MKLNNGKLFGTLHGGEYEIRSLTKEDLEQALDILYKSFYLHESVCRGTEINLPESENARKELTEMCRMVSEDGVSLVAKHVPTNKVVGVAFNKIHFIGNQNDEPFYDNFIRTKCTSKNAISLLQYMISMDEKVNLFDHYNIDCLLELTFLSTLQEYGRKGIANALVQYTIQLAKNLLNEQDLDLLNDILKDKRPKAVTATFTSIYTQKIGKKLGMDLITEVPYTEYSYNGKTYAERIDSLHPSGILYAIKI